MLLHNPWAVWCHALSHHIAQIIRYRSCILKINLKLKTFHKLYLRSNTNLTSCNWTPEMADNSKTDNVSERADVCYTGDYIKCKYRALAAVVSHLVPAGITYCTSCTFWIHYKCWCVDVLVGWSTCGKNDRSRILPHELWTSAEK